MNNNIYSLKLKDINVNIEDEINLFEINQKYTFNREKGNFNLLEKLIYELSNFHIKRLNLNKNDIIIEFSLQNNIDNKMNIISNKKLNEYVNATYPFL